MCNVGSQLAVDCDAAGILPKKSAIERKELEEVCLLGVQQGWSVSTVLLGVNYQLWFVWTKVAEKTYEEGIMTVTVEWFWQWM